MAIEIVYYLAIKTSDFLRYVNVYQRVTIPKRAVSEMVQFIQMIAFEETWNFSSFFIKRNDWRQ